MIEINLHSVMTPGEVKQTKSRLYMRGWNRKNRHKSQAYALLHKARRTAQRMKWRETHIENEMLTAAKQRAKRRGLPFELTLGDIDIPTECPILKIPLVRNRRGGPQPNSPSLDRIVPEHGYVRGNVQVISHKANTIKSDATLDELRAVVRYLEGRKSS